MSSSPHPISPNGEPDDSSDNAHPKIEALFLIRFDKKVGYTIAWKRTSTPDITLDNAVEYKSLPSGLHGVSSDLVYFTHEGHAGLSAFARGDAGAEERNAKFVSVGVLVRKDGGYGRLGRSWVVAGKLEALAKELAGDESVEPLEEFWGEVRRTETQEQNKGEGKSRARAISTGSVKKEEEEKLHGYHPAKSIWGYIDMLGPLVFRLQQAALLRKRILFVGGAPVRGMCEFVYILSILSSLSLSDSELLLPGTENLLRLPTLFNVGVHDIPSLEAKGLAGSQSEGWAACTTDEIIRTKSALYDVLVELPISHLGDSSAGVGASSVQRPRITTSGGRQIKASQRDVARYKMLHKELYRHRNQTSDLQYTDDVNEEEQPLISRHSIDAHRADDEYNLNYDDSAVEPVTWSRLAYSGFMWWASAGESSSHLTREGEMDKDLLSPLSSHPVIETGIIGYFHRTTSNLMQTLQEIIEGEEDGEEEGVLVIGREEMARLGLDGWSEADGAFVGEVGEMYFGRGVEVRGGEVECCGLRVGGM